MTETVKIKVKAFNPDDYNTLAERYRALLLHHAEETTFLMASARGLVFRCDKCGHLLREPGALYLHPPVNNQCQKDHICKPCHERSQNA